MGYELDILQLKRPFKWTQDVGSARQFFSQLRRQLGQAPRGSGWSAAACGGAGALQGALHMPRALWVSANPGAKRNSCSW
jgi:hypothetical protein